MTIEEKAKAYDEALERAKALHGTLAAGRDFLVEIFPELQESEDEKIIEGFKNLLRMIKDKGGLTLNMIPVEKCEAWLEKQKEQEHVSDSAQFEEGFKTGYELGCRKQKE